MSRTYLHDPNAHLEYEMDWRTPRPGEERGWLSEGELIVTSTWIVPVGLVVGTDSHDGDVAVLWLSGGTVGVTYEVTNRITSNQNRTDDRTIRISVTQR